MPTPQVLSSNICAHIHVCKNITYLIYKYNLYVLFGSLKNLQTNWIEKFHIFSLDLCILSILFCSMFNVYEIQVVNPGKNDFENPLSRLFKEKHFVLISTKGAFRLPTTYDNHPPQSHPVRRKALNELNTKQA